jgi:hypothetical protein
MIQKFEQFINESHAGGVFDSLREPIDGFIERVKERTKNFTERIQEISDDINKAVNDVMEEFGSIIVGEPIVDIDERSLWDVEIRFNTNIPNNDEAWETDESPAEELDIRLYDIVKRYDGVKASVLSTANEDGNCVICISADIVYKTNFGEFAYAISKFGEEY